MLAALTLAALLPGFDDTPAPASMQKTEASLYWIFLESGDNSTALEPEQSRKMQRAHLDNLGRLYKEGKSPLAGPLGDGGSLRGIVVVEAPDQEALMREFEPDPFVEHGYLKVSAYPWQMTGTIHAHDGSDDMGKYWLAMIQRPTGCSPKDARELVGEVLAELSFPDNRGPLAVAGPVEDQGRLCGIFLFHVDDPEAIEAHLSQSLILETGELTATLKPVYLGRGMLEGRSATE